MNQPTKPQKTDLFVSCVILALGACPETVAYEPALVANSGVSSKGELLTIDGIDQISMKRGDVLQTLSLRDFISWGTFPAPNSDSFVLLSDGSLLSAYVVGITNDRLRVDSDLWGQQSLPLCAVRGIVFFPPSNERARRTLVRKLQADEPASDVLVLANGDEIQGVVSGLDEEAVQVDTESRRLTFGRDNRPTAIKFCPALTKMPTKPEASLWIGFRDGSRLQSASAKFGKGPGQIELACGAKLETQFGAIWLEDCVFLQPQHDGIVYVSDKEPVAFRHQPALVIPCPNQDDHNVAGGSLRCRGRYYRKGVGVRSDSQLVYSLNEQDERFRAVVAIDDTAHDSADAVFSVLFTNDGASWRVAKRTTVLRRGDEPVVIDVTINGAKQIALAVDAVESAGVGDYANWLGACVLQSRPPTRSPRARE